MMNNYTFFLAIVNEIKNKVFAGLCNGDSGGPLFAYLNGNTYLAGVTSWDAKDCELGIPSVYARLSYYTDTIQKEGIPQLYLNETKQNRGLPNVVIEPKIIGTATKLAAALKKTTTICVKGKVTKKVTAVKPVCPTGYKKLY